MQEELKYAVKMQKGKKAYLVCQESIHTDYNLSHPQVIAKHLRIIMKTLPVFYM